MYPLLIYLFHNDSKVNQFNVLPKLILLMEKVKKINNVEIESVNMEYTIRDGKKESSIRWNLCNVKNNLKHSIPEVFFYTGIDYGIMSKVKANEKDGYRETYHELRKILESNGINLLECGLDRELRPGESLERIEYFSKCVDAFKLNHQEILYFYPLNFGVKINKINYYIQILDEYNYQIEMREIYKEKKVFTERCLKSTQGKREGEKITYKFELPKVTMSSVYYFTINRVE